MSECTLTMPAPIAGPDRAGIVTFAGGVQVIGPMVKIPGRTLDASAFAEALQHAASVVAAVALVLAGGDDCGNCGLALCLICNPGAWDVA